MVTCSNYTCQNDETHYNNQMSSSCVLEEDPTRTTEPLCEDLCCIPYTLCSQWSNDEVNECINQELPNPLKLIPSEEERYNASSDNSEIFPIERICCENVLCSDYTCPADYKEKLNASNKIVYNNGSYNPVGICCEKKTCLDWLNGGNTCQALSPLYENPENRQGYSESECCYQSCQNWGLSVSTEEDFNPCGEGSILSSNRLGWGRWECCRNKRNTCFDKTWDCPEKSTINTDNLDIICSCGTGECGETCEENDTNIESCCSSFQTCSNMLCPAKYHQNLLNKDEYCKENICNVSNDLETCCNKNQTCSDMDCGVGFHILDSSKDEYCMNRRCSNRNDGGKCCMANQTCMFMECKDGYYINTDSMDKKCYGKLCETENKFDNIRCCIKCKNIENAKVISCSNPVNSVALECEKGYNLKNGLCIKQTQKKNIIIKLDTNFDSLSIIENYRIKLKDDICNLINKVKSIENCPSKITINEIIEGSVIVSFTIDNEISTENSLSDQDINTIFKKDSLLSKLNTNISEDPTIQYNLEGEESENLTRCSDGVDNYECPFYMVPNENQSNIYGSSDFQCCSLDWSILKYVIPLFLLFIFIIYYFFKFRIDKRLRIKRIRRS